MTFKAHLLKHECPRIAVMRFISASSYSLATLEYLEPLSLENRTRIVALMPGLRKISFYILSLETMVPDRAGPLDFVFPCLVWQAGDSVFSYRDVMSHVLFHAWSALLYDFRSGMIWAEQYIITPGNIDEASNLRNLRRCQNYGAGRGRSRAVQELGWGDLTAILVS
jgi:hypothetical protein